MCVGGYSESGTCRVLGNVASAGHDGGVATPDEECRVARRAAVVAATATTIAAAAVATASG